MRCWGERRVGWKERERTLLFGARMPPGALIVSVRLYNVKFVNLRLDSIGRENDW